MNNVTIAILSTALFLSPSAAHAVLVCDPDGKPAQELRIVQDEGSFDLVRQFRGRVGLAANARIAGTYNAAAGIVAGPDGWPVVASYRAPDGRLGIAIWFQNGATRRLAGTLTSISFSTSPRAAALIGFRPEPVQNPFIARELVYSQTGVIVAERSVAWESESFARSVLSEDGSLVYRRFGPGMSSEREVVLYDSATFRKAGSFSIGAEYVTDVVVIDRRIAFLTAGGGLFRIADGRIESVGKPDLPVRHERLAVDKRSGLVLSFGSGGYQVLTFQGTPVRSSVHGRAHFGAEGFATDGSIIEGPVQGKRGLRIVDAVSGEIFTETDVSANASLRGRRIACSSKDSLVFDGEGIAGPAPPVGKPTGM